MRKFSGLKVGDTIYELMMQWDEMFHDGKKHYISIGFNITDIIDDGNEVVFEGDGSLVGAGETEIVIRKDEMDRSSSFLDDYTLYLADPDAADDAIIGYMNRLISEEEENIRMSQKNIECYKNILHGKPGYGNGGEWLDMASSGGITTW